MLGRGNKKTRSVNFPSKSPLSAGQPVTSAITPVHTKASKDSSISEDRTKLNGRTHVTINIETGDRSEEPIVVDCREEPSVESPLKGEGRVKKRVQINLEDVMISINSRIPENGQSESLQGKKKSRNYSLFLTDYRTECRLKSKESRATETTAERLSGSLNNTSTYKGAANEVEHSDARMHKEITSNEDGTRKKSMSEVIMRLKSNEEIKQKSEVMDNVQLDRETANESNIKYKFQALPKELLHNSCEKLNHEINIAESLNEKHNKDVYRRCEAFEGKEESKRRLYKAYKTAPRKELEERATYEIVSEKELSKSPEPKSTGTHSSPEVSRTQKKDTHRGMASANAKKLNLKLVSTSSNTVKCSSPKKITESKVGLNISKRVKETLARDEVKNMTTAKKVSAKGASSVVRMQTRNVLARTAVQIDTSVKRLYEEEVDKRQKKRMVYEEIRKEKELEELNYQFRPNINDLSKKIVDTSGDKLESRLTRRSKKVAERMEALRKEREMKETLNCTFRPRINQKSIALASNRSESLDTNSPTNAKYKLEETGRKKAGQADADECTFHPNIRPSMQTLQHSLSMARAGNSPGALAGRGKTCGGIGEHLYAQRRTRDSLMAVVRRAEEKARRERNRSFVQPKSREILSAKKLAVVEKVFCELDDDSDGLISHQSHSTEGLPEEIAKMLNPIFEELKEVNKPFGMDEFLESMCRLYETLDFYDKDTLFKYGSKMSNDQFSFAESFRVTCGVKVADYQPQD